MIVEKVTKKSKAIAIFNAALVMRAEGAFETNKAFRKHVLTLLVTDAQVTKAAAASMYNQVKEMAEAADPTLKLGRDPVAEKVKRVQKPKVAVEVAVPVAAEADAV